VGHNTFLEGQDFCFYYTFKKIFLGATKFGEVQKKFGGHCSQMSPVAMGLLESIGSKKRFTAR